MSESDNNKKVGSQAFGDSSSEGVSEEENAQGSAAFGAAEGGIPVKGAVMFGILQGKATGSEAFGGDEEGIPLKGSLLFGNNPDGNVGAAAFGGDGGGYDYRGALAVGAPQQFKKEIAKDKIGYNFKRPLLANDPMSLSGIKKTPEDDVRLQVLKVLNTYLGFSAMQLEHGLSRELLLAVKAHKEQRERSELLSVLRKYVMRAPGQCLGIHQTREILESFGYLHMVELKSEWQTRPLRLEICAQGQKIVIAEEIYWGRGSYFEFRDLEGAALGYVDYPPFSRKQDFRIRVRRPDKVLIATIELKLDRNEDATEPLALRILGPKDQLLVSAREPRFGPKSLALQFFEQASGEIGRTEVDGKAVDGLSKCVLAMKMPFLVVWALTLICALIVRDESQ